MLELAEERPFEPVPREGHELGGLPLQHHALRRQGGDAEALLGVRERQQSNPGQQTCGESGVEVENDFFSRLIQETTFKPTNLFAERS